MPKRILYTSFVDISIPYGPGINETGFLKDMLTRYGENLHAVIPRPSRGMPAELATLNSTYLTLSRSSRNPFGWFEARTVGAIPLWNAVRKFNPDLVVMRPGVLPIPQALIALLFKVPYVLKTAGDGRHAQFFKRNGIRRALKYFDQAILKYVFANARCIDVVSELQLRNLTSHYPWVGEHIYVIDNGADFESFDSAKYTDSKKSLGLDDASIVIGYVGNFPMRRGGKEVIDVVAALKSDSRVRGLVVGDSGEAELCREYARDRGVADLVVIYGEADYSIVPRLIAAIDCGLSILKLEERGASEQKVRQYLASGSCVVGTAGSNDFLRGYDFARVVETDESAEVIAAVTDIIAGGQPAIAELCRKARDFAGAGLTISSRNDRRLQYWAECIDNG